MACTPNRISLLRMTFVVKLPSNSKVLLSQFLAKSHCSRNRKWRGQLVSLRVVSSAIMPLEQPGGKMVVELVGAFNELTDRIVSRSHAPLLSTSSSWLLFKTLKLAIPLLHGLQLLPDGRSPLSRALSVALILADLQMDAEVISAGILREVLEGGTISMLEVSDHIGTGAAHLLHESVRLKNISSMVDTYDDESAHSLRKFCLTYYDVRAIILDLALNLDTMRHLDYLPRYKQQMKSLQVMKIHAPLAHAVGTNLLSSEMEDLSLQNLFPNSYLYVDTWLRSHETESKPLLDIYKDELLQSLRTDPPLAEMVNDISIEGRYKSRYSTMKKLLKDGRKPEEVNDILGLRVILSPVHGVCSSEIGERACYRAREIIQLMWKEMPGRSKDYIMRPKANGYRSLHMAVDVSGNGRTKPLMEIQIRTAEMDRLAAGGLASHSLYKGDLSDPEEAKRLKMIMMAAAELAALRLQDFTSPKLIDVGIDHRSRAFGLMDKNGDGKISIEELMEVMEELGAEVDDAREIMKLLDSNSDGFLSSEEFNTFQKQIEVVRNLEKQDAQDRTVLKEKLQLQLALG